MSFTSRLENSVTFYSTLDVHFFPVSSIACLGIWKIWQAAFFDPIYRLRAGVLLKRRRRRSRRQGKWICNRFLLTWRCCPLSSRPPLAALQRIPQVTSTTEQVRYLPCSLMALVRFAFFGSVSTCRVAITRSCLCNGAISWDERTVRLIQVQSTAISRSQDCR